jgi:hypothetical protein
MSLKSVPTGNYRDVSRHLTREHLVFTVCVALIYFFLGYQAALVLAICGLGYRLTEILQEIKYTNLLKEHEIGLFDTYED